MKPDDELELPPELQAKFLSFLREVNGHFELADKMGLIKFVVEHGKRYPALLKLFTVNKDAVMDHFKRTAEVPPGVTVFTTETQEGDNVTKLEIFRGPIPSKSSEP
jgi:hypothetical protein